MEMFRETLADGALGPERDRVFKDLTPKEKERFTKLNNDMRNTKMTMPKMQLNSKFMNNMLPECGRFVTTVKLNKGLKPSNYDQLYAYLKQHEAHANENKMMAHSKTMHSPKATTEFRILQGQDAADASSREWSVLDE
ncbi:hypothetical protein Tco_0845693 [Tanacetum coccineum]